MAQDKKRNKRRKVSYLTLNKIEKVEYKDILILKRFLTERGKILPRRVTGNTASQQRMVTACIQQARSMALLPYVGTIEQDRPERGERGERRFRDDR
jgi:small subunit ribosomal protein S18